MLDIKKNFFTEMVVKYWDSLPRKLLGAPSLEVFKRYVDVALSNVI